MKELVVIFLIVLVIYLNQSQCKTQKGGSTATTVGMGLVMTAIIAVTGYFAYKELTGTSQSSPDDSGDTGKVGSGSSKKRKKKGGDVINNYYFTDVGEDVIRCNPLATDPPAFCPDNSRCPASGVCPSGGGGGGNPAKDCNQIATSSCGGTRDNHNDCVACMNTIDNDCKYLTETFCASSQPDVGCQETLENLCSGERSKSEGDCFVCVGQHQPELRAVGCEQSDFALFCNQGPVPSGDEPANTYIEVKNVTSHPMWVWFNKDGGNITNHSFQPTLNKYASTTWGVQIPNGNSLYVYGNSDGWNGGQFVVTKYDSRSKANGEINISGLTSFEFTIMNGEVWGNISNVSGVNATGTMNITGLSDCDRGKTTNTNAESLLTCPPKFQCDRNVCVSGDACTLKKLTPSQINATGISSTGPKTGLTCGDNGDCLGCPLNEPGTDGCQPYPPWTKAPGDGKVGMFDSSCYGNILKKKYGCLEWWTNNSTEWKKYATQNGTDSYWWAMGEQVLGGNTYNSSITYPGGAIDAKSKGCISGTTSESDCTGYIIPNENSSLMKCNINGQPFKVIYTITGIMEHKT